MDSAPVNVDTWCSVQFDPQHAIGPYVLATVGACRLLATQGVCTPYRGCARASSAGHLSEREVLHWPNVGVRPLDSAPMNVDTWCRVFLMSEVPLYSVPYERGTPVLSFLRAKHPCTLFLMREVPLYSVSYQRGTPVLPGCVWSRKPAAGKRSDERRNLVYRVPRS